MKRSPIRILLILSLVLVLVLVAMTPVTAQIGDPLINEFVANHTGTDTNEFIEVFANPDMDYSAFTVLEIEGDGTSNPGVVDDAWQVGTTDASGYWTTGFLNNQIENGTITLLLVVGFTGSIGDDLDLDNDGNLDTPLPWSSEVDGIAVDDGGSGDHTYTSVVLTAFYDGQDFAPGGASRIPNGTDTNAVDDWVRNDFDGAGLPGFTGSPAEGEAFNTPAAVNEEVPPPPPPPQLTIMEIQGTDVFSPYAGQVVETMGVVTAISSNGRDMWIQDPAGDGDPATSDGIFVDDRNLLPDQPVVGDFVKVTAEVEDQQFDNQLPRTILDSPNDYPFEILSSGNSLPAPILLTNLPEFSIVEGIDFWVPLEGMLVAVKNAPVVAPTSGFGEFAMLAKSNAKPGSGFFSQTQQIFVTDYGDEVVDYNPERILVDDATLDEAIVVMPGDRVRSLVGVTDYTFGSYKLQPTSFDVKTHKLPHIPASRRSGPFGNTVISTYNVENLFDLELNTPVVIDSFGQVGFDPGSGWGPPSTQNNTLIRKGDVCSGRTDTTAAFDPSLEWLGTGQDNFSDLGTHSSSCSPAAGLLISEYIEGSSLNKALEIYNGTGAAVNLGASGVVVDVYFNGNSSPGQSIALSGTIANGDVYVLANPGADQAILDVADQQSGGVLWNGDDAIVLRQGGKDDAGSTPDVDELETQLTKLALSIELELKLPEIIVVQEIENQEIAQVLADRVNDAAGTAYVATSFETSDARGIEPGFLWDANRVALLDAFQLNDAIVAGVSAAFGPNSASPGREPIVGIFDIDGHIVTIVGNHFKSKGGDDPIFGVNQPFIRVTETQRKLQAQVVRDFVNIIFDADPNAMVMVAGDLNDFAFSEPGEGPDNPIAIIEGSGGEVPLYNLIGEEKESERFTYIFDGNSQVLDHMLVSPVLLNYNVAADMLHFNASYPSDLGNDPTTTLRASDHDVIEGRFKFRAVRTSLDASNMLLNNGRISGAQGADLATMNATGLSFKPAP